MALARLADQLGAAAQEPAPEGPGVGEITAAPRHDLKSFELQTVLRLVADVASGAKNKTPPPAAADEGADVDVLVPPLPALLKRDTLVQFRDLRKKIQEARAKSNRKSKPPAPPSSARRPGWATHLVLDCLAEAGGPIKPDEIQAWAKAKGELLQKSTISYALRQSRPARAGKITRHDGGFYSLLS